MKIEVAGLGLSTTIGPHTSEPKKPNPNAPNNFLANELEQSVQNISETPGLIEILKANKTSETEVQPLLAASEK